MIQKAISLRARKRASEKEPKVTFYQQKVLYLTKPVLAGNGKRVFTLERVKEPRMSFPQLSIVGKVSLFVQRELSLGILVYILIF